MKLQHKFVELMPSILEEGTIYISLEYGTAIHKCVCGCGNKVVTPITPTDWQVTFDGETISLYPSIGNWAFDCKTHYWIIKNTVKYAGKWSDKDIQRGRTEEKNEKKRYYSKNKK
jgi:hypothetical protein